MGVYHVTPMSDNESTQGFGWKVTQENVGKRSQHYKKDTALKSARRTANFGDTLFIHGRNGRVQNTVTIRTGNP